MSISGDKKVVCVTGSVWTGRRRAPRRMLVKDGFVRPTWFTTDRPLTDANYRRISTSEFHAAMAGNKVLAHIKHGGSFIGVTWPDFESAIAAADKGVLFVGPPEIAAQVAAAIPQAVVFSFKDVQMDLSPHLDEAKRVGQLHRIDVDVLEPGAWTEVYRSMMVTIGIPPKTDPF